MKKFLFACGMLLGAVNCWGQSILEVTNFQVDPSIAESPLDMTGYSRTRTLISDAITKDVTVTKEVEDTLIRLIASSEGQEKSEIRVWAEFSDGGRAQFKLAYVNILGGEYGYSYAAGTGVDGNGNKVPDSPVEFSRRFSFRGDTGKKAVEAAARFGSDIEIPLNCETVDTQCGVVEGDIHCTSTSLIC